MFGLIIVVGMLVDDAIIIAENCHRYIEEGLPIKEAASKGAREVALPVIATVLTTVVAFLPLVFMTGIMGKFVRHIPIVVIVALIVSLFEALVILPSHIAEWSQPRSKEHVDAHWYLVILKHYERFIRFAVNKRYAILLVALIVFGGRSRRPCCGGRSASSRLLAAPCPFSTRPLAGVPKSYRACAPATSLA